MCRHTAATVATPRIDALATLGGEQRRGLTGARSAAVDAGPHLDIGWACAVAARAQRAGGRCLDQHQLVTAA
eukprot:CAMPEP_0119087862 /NCGR_PEP_ID=MMETSP1178-20130426/143362_1 /TAXON_ID=33656 /ORGANISM="unid sp, Strain CCMP2000" /LENGTH=71 /DNA_ID=CAMNT_0007071105 /DNA_START=106 /DNA_END=319 /DNA_ORIENTATION=+